MGGDLTATLLGLALVVIAIWLDIKRIESIQRGDAMKCPADMPLPFPPDDQQIELIREIIEAGGHSIASEGTDRFEACSHLVDSGLLARHHCPAAEGVHQFSVTYAGREAVR